MTKIRIPITALSCAVAAALAAGCSGMFSKGGKTVNAVVVTGGHGFKQEPFFAMLDSFDGVNYVEAKQADHSEIFEDIDAWNRDVIVLYNMTQQISPKRQKNFLALLDKGVGVVAVHHSIAAFQNWPEYQKIIGCRFLLKSHHPGNESGYKHDVDLDVHIDKPSHPVVKGLKDYKLHDEVYSKCVFEPDNTVLATTEHPESDRIIALARKYRGARVCYIQSGHGPRTYADENFRRLLNNAIAWAAGN
jgi:type 1 glutamine amidotransferase